MDLIIEILFEIYLGLGEIFVPDRKFKKWQETLLKLACILVSIIIAALIIVGISFIIEEEALKITGIILLSVGCFLLAAQIILFVIVLVHQVKKEKREKLEKNEKNENTGNDESQI